MKEMKVRVIWNNDDQYWMNPDNLLLALRAYCPNTKFECQYLIHPNADKMRKEMIRIKYEKNAKKLDKKCLRYARKYKKRVDKLEGKENE